ncbi:MAG: O-antigen ligase family protein [Bacteroidetes bacterium]|nr:O-antigen ligase family protein [Bacteroidota bacterium]
MNFKSISRLQAFLLISGIISFGIFMTIAIFRDSLILKAVALSIPFLLLLIYFAVLHPKIFVAVLIVLLPLSINLENTPFGFGISLPAEVLVTLMAFLVLVNLVKGKDVDFQFIKHPVSIAILINLIWMFLTSLTSTMPLISVKYLFIRINFLLVFYYLIAQLFGTKQGVQLFFWLYGSSLLVVIFIILLKHSQFGFTQEVNHWAAKPFFKDHTIYGACVVMMLPFFIARIFIKQLDLKFPRIFSFAIVPLLLVSIFTSYSRAVWLSIGIISIFLILLQLKIPAKYISLGLVLLVLSMWFVREPILIQLQDVQSQRGTDVKEHLTSAANIESSVSNKERVNRWECAIDMFLEKPFLGYGPGTYPFQYAPFQNEENMTIISTYDGDKGGVHSEYLKPLVESGIIGFLTFGAILLMVLRSSIRLIYRTKDKSIKLLTLSLLLGLSTYYFHGFVNYFSETDKAAVLFWGMAGLIVALDIKEKKVNTASKTYVNLKNISF